MPKSNVRRARKDKEESRSKSVSIVIASLMIVAIMLGGAMLSDANYSSTASDYRTRSAEGWSEDVRISYNFTADESPSIAVDGEVVHIVWRSTWSGGQIFYTRSTNAGETWDEPVMIGPLEYYCRNPDIAVSGNNVHVVWNNNNASAQEIRYLRSVDGGNTWLPERMISSDDGNNSQAPKIAVSEDGMDVHVVWVDERHADDPFQPTLELYYNRSLDGGVTWEGEVRLTEAEYESTGPNIAVDGSSVHVVWMDERAGKWDVYYRRSLDSGATWDEEAIISDSSNDEGPVDVAASEDTIHVVWVETISGEDVILHRRSTDDGGTWSEPQLLTGPSVRAWSPKIAVLEDEVHMVWFDGRDGGNEIYYKYSGDGGITWEEDTRLTYTDNSESLTPDIALDNDKIHVVWRDDRDGDLPEIYYKRHPDFINVPEFGNLILPVITTLAIYISYNMRRKNQKRKKGEKYERK